MATCTCNPSTGEGGDRMIARAYWVLSLLQVGNRSCPEGIWQRMIEQDTDALWPPQVCACTHIHTKEGK